MVFMGILLVLTNLPSYPFDLLSSICLKSERFLIPVN